VANPLLWPLLPSRDRNQGRKQPGSLALVRSRCSR
jgi:hypothetical protein